MTRKHKNHSPEFKAKVALAAAKGDKTISELAQQFSLRQNQITTWNKELIDNAATIFSSTSSSKEVTDDVDKLRSKIGQ